MQHRKIKAPSKRICPCETEREKRKKLQDAVDRNAMQQVMGTEAERTKK